MNYGLDFSNTRDIYSFPSHESTEAVNYESQFQDAKIINQQPYGKRSTKEHLQQPTLASSECKASSQIPREVSGTPSQIGTDPGTPVQITAPPKACNPGSSTQTRAHSYHAPNTAVRADQAGTKVRLSQVGLTERFRVVGQRQNVICFLLGWSGGRLTDVGTFG